MPTGQIIERSSTERARGAPSGSATRWVKQDLAGWGNLPIEACNVARPESAAAMRAAVRGGMSVIPRGLGRAYGDSALNAGAGVVLQRSFDHFLAFDPTTGDLTTQGGVSLGEIMDVMLPRGWFLPTTPGTRFVTVGGAIAADVHGKNHHADGSFGKVVTALELMTASGDLLPCSPTRNADVFWATVGGMGLTGIITRATLKMINVPSAYAKVRYVKARSLDEILAVSAETEASTKYSVAWIDCVARGRKMGRSVLMLGEHAQADEVRDKLLGPTGNPLALPRKRTRRVPFFMPSFALNPLSVKLFNAAYYAKARDGEKLVDFATFFYPLDGVLDWNRIYGRRGFAQYQALVPRETARAGLRKLLEKISNSGISSFLAVLKASGAEGQGMLSFMRPGYTLALDMPNVGQKLHDLARDLDKILLDHGGRLYMAKDALTDAQTFREMYPRLDAFQAVKAKVDPAGRFDSSQARRLGITRGKR